MVNVQDELEKFFKLVDELMDELDKCTELLDKLNKFLSWWMIWMIVYVGGWIGFVLYVGGWIG